ncbi:hypothetical protein PC9H_005896 [Pleurotus ostreatus]|uniref:F-box domain-containing protein n=1 Tax=Pleurotus ostreatus TaxID=5322 RepID=A0A8H6ZZY7_PLEOS|nr:uncharacterized protein PC9H_005896 [Pleurotus ostreatus]KAF7430196.1 hypothetical protein PC9H_005896 [Pleurotus ostreatus]KAJ8701272.1 hypothetical protein PTI98_000077 [Pleurotus ostreatus]
MGQTSSRKRTSTGKTGSYPQPHQRLPNELVIAIIGMVEELDALRALALVCHGWLYLCRSLIHRTIVVDERGGTGGMPKKKFIRIYTKYPHLCEHVLDVSFNLARSTKTDPFHPCLLRFKNLRSLNLHSYADPFEFPRGVLSPSMIALIPCLLASSRLTRLSLVGFTPHTILDLLRSNEMIRTNLHSLALIDVFRPEWDPSTLPVNPHPVLMIGLHELEIDCIPSYESLGVETPSLQSLTALYRPGVYSIEHFLPRTCPPTITNLTLEITAIPPWTTAIASTLHSLTQLETLTLDVQSYKNMNYTDQFPWLCACIGHLKDVCQLQRLEIRLRDQLAFRTLSPLDFLDIDDILSEMNHEQSLKAVYLKLTAVVGLPPPFIHSLPHNHPDPASLEAQTIAGFPHLTEADVLRVSVTLEEEVGCWFTYA